MRRRHDAKAGSLKFGRHVAMRFAAFAFLGMAAGVPAAVVDTRLSVLPGISVIYGLFSASFVSIGIITIARILWAPILDSTNAPLLGRFGRRRGWVAILLPALAALSIAVGLQLPMSSVSPSPVYLGLLIAAIVVAGGLFAAVDGLRSVQPDNRTQGILATGQYVGVFVPSAVLTVVAQIAGNPYSRQYEFVVPVFWIMTGFLSAGWIGLWLLPGKDPEDDRIFDLPRVQRFFVSSVNLSAGGRRLTGWLYGVFVCPVIDFFERGGKTALLALLVLLVGSGVNQWLGAGFESHRYPGSALQIELQSIASAVAVLNVIGLISSGALVYWLSPARGFAAALAFILVGFLASIIAARSAPAMSPAIAAYLVVSFAHSAFFIAVIALIARLVTPRFAAFQFSLLVIFTFQTGVSRTINTAIQSIAGSTGSRVIILIVTLIALKLAVVLARRLE